MNRYEEYKDTRIKWISKIPISWEEIRFKYALPMVTTKSTSDVKIGLENIESYSAKFIHTDSVFEGNGIEAKKGDILYGKLRPYLAKVLLAEYDCNAVGDFYVFRCNESLCTANFAKWLILSDNFTKICSASTYGAKMPRVSSDFINSLYIPLPPLAEQEKIVRFLEDKTSKIDALLEKKGEQIKLLNELKESEIANIITRGLNPDVKMKSYNSLIASAYPEHWELKRNKSFMSLTGYKVGNNANQYTLLSLTTKGVIVRDIESGKGKFPKEFDDYQVVKKDELVFCLFDIDETPRTVGLVNTEGMITGAYTALKVNREYAIPEYIYYYYLCVDNIKALKPYYSGLRKTVRADKFLQLYMPLPPIDEQCAIVSYIEDKCNKINSLITELEGEIEYLKEYKQKLIADCVTGQIDVRNM